MISIHLRAEDECSLPLQFAQYVLDGQDVCDGLVDSRNVMLMACYIQPGSSTTVWAIWSFSHVRMRHRSCAPDRTAHTRSRPSPVVNILNLILYRNSVGKSAQVNAAALHSPRKPGLTHFSVFGVSDKNRLNSDMRSDPPLAPQRRVRIYGCVDYESTNSHSYSWYARNNRVTADRLTPSLQRPLRNVLMGESSSLIKSPLPATSPTPCGLNLTLARTELR